MDKLKKLQQAKYTAIGLAGVALLLIGIALDSSLVRGFAYYLMAWAILGDILNGVEWHKHTTINTKNVDYYSVQPEDPKRAEGE